MCDVLSLVFLRFRVTVFRSRAGSRPTGVAATENRTNSDVTIVRCTNIVPIVSCRNACWLRIINWQVAEENGVVIHTPLALTHTFLPRRPAYPEAWRQYTLHKPRRIRFLRRKTYAKGIGDLYQIDLADLSNISLYNDGARYLLTYIDVFSKMAWAVPVRTKTGRDIANAFEKNLSDGIPNVVQSDKGTEFLNSTFQRMLKRHGTKFYTSKNED